MINFLKALREFHRAVFKKTGDYRSDINQVFIADNPTAHLRARLVEEEAAELADALMNGTREDVLKELCDVLYVSFGLAATYDLPLEAAFSLVHENNMLKLANGKLREDGKFTKAKDHPKVDLSILFKTSEDKARDFTKSIDSRLDVV